MGPGQELGSSLQSAGLVLENFAINWGLTDWERKQVAQRRGEIEELAKKFDHQRRLAELQRGLEIDQTRLEEQPAIETGPGSEQRDVKGPVS